MCFNALISNTDDHPRNHAILAKDRDCKLSPAYDLTPTPLVSLERRDLAMICGDQGRVANANNLISQSARFLLSEDEAKSIVDATKDRVKGAWYETARTAGVSEKDCERIAGGHLPIRGHFEDQLDAVSFWRTPTLVHLFRFRWSVLWAARRRALCCG
jgi:serine/threonine-protein kinase HipA